MSLTRCCLRGGGTPSPHPSPPLLTRAPRCSPQPLHWRPQLLDGRAGAEAPPIPPSALTSHTGDWRPQEARGDLTAEAERQKAEQDKDEDEIVEERLRELGELMERVRWRQLGSAPALTPLPAPRSLTRSSTTPTWRRSVRRPPRSPSRRSSCSRRPIPNMGARRRHERDGRRSREGRQRSQGLFHHGVEARVRCGETEKGVREGESSGALWCCSGWSDVKQPPHTQACVRREPTSPRRGGGTTCI